MSNTKHIIQYIAAAIIVMILGGFVGWYVFVRSQIDATDELSAARGVGIDASVGGELGSSISNLSGGTSGATSPAPTVPQATEKPSVSLWGRIKSLFAKAPTLGGTGTFSDGTFGGALGGAEGTSQATGNTPSETITSAAPRLWQISRTPVAGLGFSGTSPRLYFAERASGNILIADPERTLVERMTNTLFARTIEAHFASDGSVVLRSLDENDSIVSYAARIATSSSAQAGDAPNRLEGIYLPRDVISIGTRSAPNTFFFVVPDPTGGSAGITVTWQGTNQRRVFASALVGWRAIMAGDALYILQKPSDGAAGYFYRVASDGTLGRVLGDLPGLIALPKSGTNSLLYSTSDRGAVSLVARVGGADRELPLKTVADKCVWVPGSALVAYCAVPEAAPGGDFLRDWYSGKVHTKDAWWRVDAAAGTVERIAMPETEESLDVVQPAVDASGSYIAFLNGADRSLWMLSLNR